MIKIETDKVESRARNQVWDNLGFRLTQNIVEIKVREHVWKQVEPQIDWAIGNAFEGLNVLTTTAK